MSDVRCYEYDGAWPPAEDVWALDPSDWRTGDLYVENGNIYLIVGKTSSSNFLGVGTRLIRLWFYEGYPVRSL